METMSPSNGEAMGPPIDQPQIPELQPAFDEMADSIAAFEEQFAESTQAEIDAEFENIVASIQDMAEAATENGEELVSATAEISVTEIKQANSVDATVSSDIVDIETRPIEDEAETEDIDAEFTEIIVPIKQEMTEVEVFARAEQIVAEAIEIEMIETETDEIAEAIKGVAAEIEQQTVEIVEDSEASEEQIRNEFKLYLVSQATERLETGVDLSEEEVGEAEIAIMQQIEAVWISTEDETPWEQVDAIASATEELVSEIANDDELEIDIATIIQFSTAAIMMVARQAAQQQDEPVVISDSMKQEIDSYAYAA